MNIEKINKTTVQDRTTKESYLRTSKLGTLAFSTRFTSAAGIKEGDYVEMFYDKDKKQMYLVKTTKETGYCLRRSNKQNRGRSLMCNSASAVKSFHKKYEINLNRRYPVGETPVQIEGFECYPIFNTAPRQ